MSENLHDRLDREHADALLSYYSGHYETWLEERVDELEGLQSEAHKKIERLYRAIVDATDLDSRSSTREGWKRDIVKAMTILRSTLARDEDSK